MQVGSAALDIIVTTGTLLTPCTLDVDGNDSQDALTDGLIILRALFGLTGTSVTNGAIGKGATRSTWTDLKPHLNSNCGTNFVN